MKNRFLVTAAAAAFALTSALAAPSSASTTYTIDKGHSDVSFQVRHFVTKVRGNFGDFAGTIVKDDADLSKASVEFTIQAASIDTGIADRDNHLKSPDFFDVANHPTIAFKSTKVEKVSETEYKVTGDFTMRGVTKVITLPVSFDGEVADGRGGYTGGFSTSSKINRKEFNINWNKALDNGGFVLSDDVDVAINLEVKRK